MAKFTQKLSEDTRYSIILEVTEKTITSTDIANNSSRIDYTLTAKKSGGSGFYSSSATNIVKFKVDGDPVVDIRVAYDFRNTDSIVLTSGTTTIPHNADGSKTIAVQGYFKDVNNDLGKATAGGDVQLSQLHKPPTFESMSRQQSIPSGFLPAVAPYAIVDNISYLGIKPVFTAYDGAEPITYSVTCDNIQGYKNGDYYWLNFIDKIPASWIINIVATDSLGAKSTYQFGSNGMPYVKPTINKITAKRIGQLSGDVQIKANGTFYFGGGFQTTILPVVTYSVKDLNDNSYVCQEQSATIIYPSPMDGTWSIDESVSGCNFQHSFEVEIKATDNLITARNTTLPAGVSGATIPTTKTIVPVGEPTWTEHKDYVDFKRLTRQKNEVYGIKELYYDAEGTNGNVTLEETCENFEYVEIFYYTNSGNYYGSSKIYLPNGKTAQLKAENDDGTYNYMYTANYTFNGTTLTRNTEYRWRLAGSGSSNRAATSTIHIYRVIGYK